MFTQYTALSVPSRTTSEAYSLLFIAEQYL